MGAAIAGGAASGLLGGALANQREGEKNAGNVYSSETAGQRPQDYRDNIQNSLLMNKANTLGNAAGQVEQNPILGQFFGSGGLLGQTLDQEKQQANQGFQLTPEDQTAYGQASGNISRMFGQSDQGLAQSLANRGLSSSGVAAQAFSGSYGNKQEQLAGLQTQIAENRMKMNQQRLAQTQNFLGQLGGQAQNAIGQQFGANEEQAMNQYGMSKGMLDATQGQMNEQLGQGQQTQHASTLSNMVSGGAQGGMAGAKMAQGAQGGQSGGGMSGR